ncbi:MAG: sugar phosphate isomerase/epimerase [Verrucomicrobiales bacterium]|nr:sugar phosphate isomerase/epimerase [Verrucomicrobiales bacterium]
MKLPTLMNRRSFLATTTVAAAGLAIPSRAAETPTTSRPGMKCCLVPGSIGVRADQDEAIRLAAQHGFDAVEPMTGAVARLDGTQLADLLGRLKEARLVWGQAGFPLDFRGSDDAFRKSLDALPDIAAALQRAGVDRVGTWLSPAHPELTYVQNFRQHAYRLREGAKVLRDHGQRLGLEYVGTHTLLIRQKYPFIHTLAETLDLIEEIGTGNVGIVADSWHWWQAGDSAEALRQLKAARVVSVDLNDAPTGVDKRAQQDGQRELPAATGVIPVTDFLGALRAIGFDGPVRAEPFNGALNALDNDAACAATIKALRQAMATIG